MERNIRLYQSFVSLIAFLLMASAEIPDEYAVYKIQQKSECPTIVCPWNCERYIDKNGCLFCGKCQQKTTCPLVNCPNLPYFQCIARVGRDGCTVCKCRVKPRITCPLSPMCSQNCHLEENPFGCPRCVCPPNVNCPLDSQQTTPCMKDCRRERGADGCYHCRCPNDIDVCPEVKCDPIKKCTHVFDKATGCATGCQCGQNNI